MKYSYVALSAMALASGASAAPLGSAFFGTQEQTQNENAGIMNVDRRGFTSNIGVGNGVSDGSNVAVGGGSKISITAKPLPSEEQQQKRSPLMSLSFGSQKAKGNSNAGIMTVERRGGDTENYGVGNGVTDASNVGIDGGSIIKISRRGDTSNYGVGNGVSDGSNVGVSGGSQISIGRRGDTRNFGVGNGVSDASNVDIGGGSAIQISRRGDTENYGVGNGVSDGSNVGVSGESEISIGRRGDTSNYGVGNGVSDGSNVGVSGGSQISIGRRGDTENYGVGNGVSDASNVDVTGGSAISIGKRSPLMDFKFGTDSQKVNSNAGIMSVEARGYTENIGVGNGVSDASNVDIGGGSKISISAPSSEKRSPLMDFRFGTDEQKVNSNAGIMTVERRGDTENIGVGNDVSDGSNVDVGGGSKISIIAHPAKRLISAGSSSTTQNQNGGIAHIPAEMYASMMAQKGGAQQQQQQKRLISAGSSSTTQNSNGGIAHIPAEMYASMMAQKGGAQQQQQKRLISAGSSSTTQNQNGGIAHIPKEMYAQMMAQKQQQPQERSMTENIGVGNGVSDGSNVGVSGSSITISARDTENYGVGNGVSDGSNVGIDGAYISIHDRDLLA